MSNEVEIPMLTPEVSASLFEETEKEVSQFNENEDTLLAPEAPEEDIKNGDMEINAETILSEIMDIDDNGHSKSIIIAAIEKLHNVEEDMDLSLVSDDDHEYIDDITIEDCRIDMYTLDGIIFNLVMKFDNSKSAYLKEINEMCNRYRVMQEDMATNPNSDASIVPMMSLTFMPHSMNGQGAMVLSFPIGFFRVLDDDGVNCSFFMQFWATNVSFTKIDIDEDMKSELTADVLRELEQGNNGQMFE